MGFEIRFEYLAHIRPHHVKLGVEMPLDELGFRIFLLCRSRMDFSPPAKHLRKYLRVFAGADGLQCVQ